MNEMIEALQKLVSFQSIAKEEGTEYPYGKKVHDAKEYVLGVGLLGDKFLLPVKIVVAGIVMVWNYLGRKIFVYGGKNAGNGKKGEEKE